MVENVVNDLQILSNTQFIESRVYDEEPEDLTPGIDSSQAQASASSSKKVKSDHSQILPKIKESLSSGLKFVDDKFSGLTKPVASSHSFDDDSEDDDHVADEILSLMSTNRFTEHRLPHLIGGEEFRRDSFIGLKADTHVSGFSRYDTVDVTPGIEASGERDEAEYDSGDDDFNPDRNTANIFSDDDEPEYHPDRGLFGIPEEPISIQSPLNNQIFSENNPSHEPIVTKPVTKMPNLFEDSDDDEMDQNNEDDDVDFREPKAGENRMSTPKPPLLTFKDELESKLFGVSKKSIPNHIAEDNQSALQPSSTSAFIKTNGINHDQSSNDEFHPNNQISRQKNIPIQEKRRNSKLFDDDSDNSDNDSHDIFKSHPVISTKTSTPKLPPQPSKPSSSVTQSSAPSSKPSVLSSSQPPVMNQNATVTSSNNHSRGPVQETRRKSLFGGEDDDEDSEDDNIFSKKSTAATTVQKLTSSGNHSRKLFSDSDDDEDVMRKDAEKKKSFIQSSKDTNLASKPIVTSSGLNVSSVENKKPVVLEKSSKKLFESSDEDSFGASEDEDDLFAPKVEGSKSGKEETRPTDDGVAKNGDEDKMSVSHVPVKSSLAEVQSSSSSLSSASVLSSNAPFHPDLTSPDPDAVNNLFGSSESDLFQRNDHNPQVIGINKNQPRKEIPSPEANMSESSCTKKAPFGGVPMFGGITGHIQAAAAKRQDEKITSTSLDKKLIENNNTTIVDPTKTTSIVETGDDGKEKKKKNDTSSDKNSNSRNQLFAPDDSDDELFATKKSSKATKSTPVMSHVEEDVMKTKIDSTELISATSDAPTVSQNMSVAHSTSAAHPELKKNEDEEKGVKPQKKPPVGGVPMFGGFNPLMADLKTRIAKNTETPVDRKKEKKTNDVKLEQKLQVEKIVDDEETKPRKSDVRPPVVTRKLSDGPPVIHIDSFGMPRSDSIQTLSSDLQKSRPKAAKRRPPSKKPLTIIDSGADTPRNENKEDNQPIRESSPEKERPDLKLDIKSYESKHVVKKNVDHEEDLKPELPVMKSVSVSIAKIIRSPSTEGEDQIIPGVLSPDSGPDANPLQTQVSTSSSVYHNRSKALLFEDSDDDNESFFTPKTSISPQTSKEKMPLFINSDDSDEEKLKQPALDSSKSSGEYKNALSVPSSRTSSHHKLKSPLDDDNSSDEENLFVSRKSSSSSADVISKNKSNPHDPRPIQSTLAADVKKEEPMTLKIDDNDKDGPPPVTKNDPMKSVDDKKVSKGLFDDDSDDDGKNCHDDA